MNIDTASHISIASLCLDFFVVTMTVVLTVWIDSIVSSQAVFESPKFSWRYVMIACSFETGTGRKELVIVTSSRKTPQKNTNVSVCFFFIYAPRHYIIV